MGKIVKYCSSCDEGFAEKFAFCPNCAQSLEAFELNPVAPVAREAAPAAAAEEVTAAPLEMETVERINAPAEIVNASPAEAEAVVDEHPIADEPVEETFTPVPVPPPVYTQPKAVDIDRKPAAKKKSTPTPAVQFQHDNSLSDDGFYVTVIEEKNGKQRNALLLGTLACMVVAMIGLTVYSLFAKDLGIAAIGGDDMFLASLIDTPVEVEKEMKQEKEDKGGGGGGGGNEDPNPASRGERAPMRTDPQFKPSVTMDRLTNPTIPIQMAIKGPVNENKVVADRYGLKLGADLASDGGGVGGGQGNGRGGGQGNGNGLGYGNGNGSGIGNGNGNGFGDGNGPGGDGPPPARKAPAVTTNLAIISKPRPGYTDSARQANIQGTVILRVTFLGNGQIGSISPVKGLPNGLTEQAIAAARRISFEPKKVDGQGVSVTKQIEYTFSIY